MYVYISDEKNNTAERKPQILQKQPLCNKKKRKKKEGK